MDRTLKQTIQCFNGKSIFQYLNLFRVAFWLCQRLFVVRMLKTSKGTKVLEVWVFFSEMMMVIIFQGKRRSLLLEAFSTWLGVV